MKSTNLLVKENDMVYLPATVGAEIAYVFELFGMPFRAIVQGLGEVGEAPFAIARGALEHEERQDQADRD